MSGPNPNRRPPSNRQRVEDYYGVHDTGMGSRPAPPPAPAGPTVPPRPSGTPSPGQVPPAPRRPRVIPPPEVQVAAQEAARAAAGAPPQAPGSPSVGPTGAPSAAPAGGPAPEARAAKPDPLTDPLTSETFQGVQQASDTFDAGVIGGFGYSTSTGPQTASNSSATTFDGGFDQFAPPRFEPRAEGRAEALWAEPVSSPDGADQTFEATFAPHDEPVAETLDEPDDSYIDVEVVDVEVHAHEAADAAGEVAADLDEEPVQPYESEIQDGEVHEAQVQHAEFVDHEHDAEEPAAEEPAEGAAAEETAGVEEPAQPVFREPLAIDPFPYTQIDETYVDAETLQTLQVEHEPKEPGDMTEFNESLNEAMNIDGALGVALVDAQSGMALATAGEPSSFNLEVAAAGNSALVQAMGRTLGDMDLDDHIEDILITLGTQYQIVRPINQGSDDLFLYLVLDRSRANLAMARFRLTKLAEQIEV
ncbi:hypothetical protein [Tsukamurella sp. NPDC003166]|uniref:roadblock/LC7 domain-containing protein n=1 Tax=Tsukamurella sp. NPDC003166 TaxID=3154444 RepID=UPI0033A25E35